jgi:hypothetical protein
MSLDLHEIDSLREAWPFAPLRALKTLSRESLKDPVRVTAHIALWQEAEACAAMLAARTLRLVALYGPHLPGDGGSTFEEHAQGYAEQYLGALEQTLDGSDSLTDEALYDQLVEAIRDLRAFEEGLKNAGRGSAPALEGG